MSSHLYRSKHPETPLSKLEQIVEARRKSLVEVQETVPVQTLLERISQMDRPPMNALQHLKEHAFSLAAEYKRRSPSKGKLEVLAFHEYLAAYGSSPDVQMISVLTEPEFFWGSLEDLCQARAYVGEHKLLLRKDFILDEYQVIEARAYGADTLLLMVSILETHELRRLIYKCREMGMEPLVEVASTEEMGIALECEAKLIGVNNRDLHTFETDIQRSVDCARNLPEDVHLCSLSGISSRSQVRRLRVLGFSTFLVGEYLMESPNPTSLGHKLMSLNPRLLKKVCGLTSLEDAQWAIDCGADLLGFVFVPGTPRYRDNFSALCTAINKQRDTMSLGDLEALRHLSHPEPVNLIVRRHFWSHVRNRPLLVGVFQNATYESIENAVKACHLDMVQLHGCEDSSDFRRLVLELGVMTIEVVHHENGKSAEVKRSNGWASLELHDTAKGSTSGGTGEVFEWSSADITNGLVAGGLDGSNVPACLEALPNAEGVDASSRLEKAAGKKDSEKVKAYCQIASNHWKTRTC